MMLMALYSGRSLFQVHYTDYEEFPFQVHPRNSPCHITWRIKVTRGERRVLTRDTLRICQIRHVRNPLTSYIQSMTMRRVVRMSFIVEFGVSY